MSVSLHLQTSLDFITHLDNRNYPAMAATMAPDFTHRFLPATLQGFGKPTRDKEEFIQHVKNLEPVFEKLNYLPPLDIVESNDAVVLHMVTDGKTRSGKPYNNEYIFTFRFNADGVIRSVQEFMDTHYVRGVLAGEAGAASDHD